MQHHKRSRHLGKILIALGILVILIIGSIFGYMVGTEEDFTKTVKAAIPTSYEASLPASDDHIIVKFKDDLSKRDQSKIKEETQTKDSNIVNAVGAEVLEVEDDTNSRDAVLEYRSKFADKIDYAELDVQMKPTLIPNDPQLPNQWALPKMDAYNGWNISQGSEEVKIAVLDTGVNINHPDLVNKLAPGYNVVDNNTDLTDLHGHGTLMMGIAGAQTNNSIGIAGVGINPKIMMLRISNNEYGWAYSSDMAEAITYATDNGAKVISISFGSTYPSATIRNAVDYANARGVFITAAAGNDGITQPNYPAAFEHVVSVGATDQNDIKASWSNYGSWVDVTAPGVSIRSTNEAGNYSSVSGTSPATPHVAGLAALALSENNTLTPLEVENYIKTNTNDLGSVGRDDIYGYGRINIKKTLEGLSGPVPIMPNGSISGTIRSNWNNTPIVGARINVIQNGTSKALITSSADGTYAAVNLPEGIYELSISATGHISQYTNWAVVNSGQVSENNNFTLVVDTRVGSMTIKVITYKFKPASYATVVVELVSSPRPDVGPFVRTIKLNSWGRAYVKNLPEGTYNVKALYHYRYARANSVQIVPDNRVPVVLRLSKLKYYQLIKSWIVTYIGG